MERSAPLPNPIPFYETKPRYDSMEFNLSHLKPQDGEYLIEEKKYPYIVKFGSHCCSAPKQLGSQIIDHTRPNEIRYFCPVRWLFSLKLADIGRNLFSSRLFKSNNYQWVFIRDAPGCSGKWVVFIKVVPGPPAGRTVIAVETSYLASVLPPRKTEESFKHIFLKTVQTGQLYGDP